MDSALAVLSRLAERRGAAGSRAIRRLLDGNLRQLAIPALRIAYQKGGPLSSVLAREIRRANDIHLAAELYNTLNNGSPEFPVGNGGAAFGDIAVIVGRQVLDYALAHGDPVRLQQEAAPLFSNLVAWHVLLGQTKSAERVARRALRFFSDGENANDPARSANFATALDALALSLRQAGLAGQADIAGRKVIALLRELAPLDPNKFEPDLARNLVNWAGGINDPQRQAEKLAAFEEAVALYRKHQTANPLLMMPLCLALIGFVTVLVEANEFERAEAAVEEAVSLGRELDLRNHDGLAVALVMAKHNAAMVAQRRGKVQGALVHLADAVNDARTLYQQSASAHWALLAHCLSSKATALVIAEKLNDAYTDLKEAVGLVPADSAENSGAEAKGIADRYLNFGIVALELNRFEEAHVAGQRAEVLYRWLAESDPSRYEDALSTVAELQQKAAPGLRSSSDKYTASSA